MSKTKIIKAGKDPDCVHREHIDGGLIGTCRKCGQIKDYRSIMAGNIDLAVKVSHGDATLEQVQESRAKGGIASRKVRRGSVNENSAAWAGIKRPPATREQLPVLTKGVDF